MCGLLDEWQMNLVGVGGVEGHHVEGCVEHSILGAAALADGLYGVRGCHLGTLVAGHVGEGAFELDLTDMFLESKCCSMQRGYHSYGLSYRTR